MTTEPTGDQVLLSFETLARPSRFIRINGEPYELADDRDFSLYEHGRLERLRRRVTAAMFSADGSELTEEMGEIAEQGLAELMTMLIPGAVGRMTSQKPRPTDADPDPEALQIPVLEALNTMQCVQVMELFTPPSAGDSAIDAIVRLLGAAMGQNDPTTGDSSSLASTPSTAPPPVAAVTG